MQGRVLLGCVSAADVYLVLAWKVPQGLKGVERIECWSEQNI